MLLELGCLNQRGESTSRPNGIKKRPKGSSEVRGTVNMYNNDCRKRHCHVALTSLQFMRESPENSRIKVLNPVLIWPFPSRLAR